MPHTAEFSSDRHAITQLLVGWGLWRDTCNWPRLRASYTADARMRTTWFDGPAGAFVDASEKMAASGAVGLQHYMSTPVVDVQGDRALATSRVVLLVRGQLDGVPVDATCYGRFHDRLVRQGGQWLIHSRIPVYEKDRIEPVEPQQAVSFDHEALQRFPPHYRYLAYMQSRGGAVITMDLPAPLSAAERQLAQDDHLWLQGAAAGAGAGALHIELQPQS